MKVSEYIVKEIEKMGTTDAFGIPGGVVLPFLYELEKSSIRPHLTYHEQTAGFAACGYAQVSGTLGVAYATRGPGISNMFTAIAEAYQESISVLFITSHGKNNVIDGQRFGTNQELDIVASVLNITKYAASIDEVHQIVCVDEAIKEATNGRKGPALIDLAAGLWDKEIDISLCKKEMIDRFDSQIEISKIGKHISASRYPVILIGDGIRYAAEKQELLAISEKLKIPIISSRGAQDILSGSPYYYGYIGSHGIRYSNFILSKADLIIAVGNRMAFSHESSSFGPILRKSKIIRIDIDEGELKKHIPGEIAYRIDARFLIYEVTRVKKYPEQKADWIAVCDQLRYELNDEDCTVPVQRISEYLLRDDASTYVCDVGNNEFWFSRAYEKTRCNRRVLISKSFGTLGSALGKSIGAYYATRKKVVCVVGDQGFQFNIQELQYLVGNHLPIKILLINNECSGMIEDNELNRYEGKILHVTKESGYYVPDFMEIIKAYGAEDIFEEIKLPDDIALSPTLPRGRACQDMEPALDREKYYRLNKL